ncbi:ANTAR domain-containing protein [Streptomyces sp. TRM66268-LWL]|uniref:ANTAR domain-containing protein n=2 Tax=Streptomyces polyasparticus TaxID=2767826 RepID=A0ABR7SGK6_9ACTN|nr:ANTAR domain-containing protein [Streptomyces polyasparticus]
MREDRHRTVRIRDDRNRTVEIREDRWALKAEVAWGDRAPAQTIGLLRAENETLRRALAGHALIDQARGMVMVLTPCSRGEARSLLVDVARQSGLKLREVAAAFVATSDGTQLPRRLHPALCRALQRLHAAQRRAPDRRAPGRRASGDPHGRAGRT